VPVLSFSLQENKEKNKVQVSKVLIKRRELKAIDMLVKD
jgi:hypothetical protein